MRKLLLRKKQNKKNNDSEKLDVKEETKKGE